MKLYASPVVFEETPHRYLLNGKELSGVTSMLRRQLPSQYDGVPDFVLKKAADFGSSIHDQIEKADITGVYDNPLVEKYVSMCKEEGLTIVANEYLVSDEEHIASKIDQVFTDGEDEYVILSDVKTTAQEKGISDLPHRESVTYQLNVYRVLFERYNPHLKVKRLVVPWLDKKNAENSKIYEVAFIPDNVIVDMIEADKSGELFSSYMPIVVKKEGELPQELVKLESAIITITEQAKFYEDQKKELQAKFLQAMEAYNIKSWDMPSLTVTRVLPTTKKTFDSKAFKEDHPDLYNEYIKESEVKGSVRFNINKEKK